MVSEEEMPPYEWRCANAGLARVWNGLVIYTSRENETAATIAKQLHLNVTHLIDINRPRLRGLRPGRQLYPYTPLVVPMPPNPVPMTAHDYGAYFGSKLDALSRPSESAKDDQGRLEQRAKRARRCSKKTADLPALGEPPADASWGPPIRAEECDPVSGSELRRLIREFGLDFSAMARTLGGRDVVGRLQKQYYASPIAAREEELLGALGRLPRLSDDGADWSFEDEWLVKVERKRRYYRCVRVAYRGRAWDIVPGPLSDVSDRRKPLLAPLVYAPDVPDAVFPVFVVDVYLDEGNDAILAFKWFYSRDDDLPPSAEKHARRWFHERELAVGSSVFTTPVDYVRDVALVGSSPEDAAATFFCRTEFDDRIGRIRPLLAFPEGRKGD